MCRSEHICPRIARYEHNGHSQYHADEAFLLHRAPLECSSVARSPVNSCWLVGFLNSVSDMCQVVESWSSRQLSTERAPTSTTLASNLGSRLDGDAWQLRMLTVMEADGAVTRSVWNDVAPDVRHHMPQRNISSSRPSYRLVRANRSRK